MSIVYTCKELNKKAQFTSNLRAADSSRLKEHLKTKGSAFRLSTPI